MNLLRPRKWLILRSGLILALLLLALAGAGCSSLRERTLPGQLRVQPVSTLQKWAVPEHLLQSGTGNLCRVVESTGLGAEMALELAAGGQGELEYFAESDALTDVAALLRVQFLSTQGAGRIKISARDAAGQELAAVGWAFTGPLPAKLESERWTYRSFGANFSGCWLEERHIVSALFSDLLPPAMTGRVEKYRVSVIVSQGQHALITQLQLLPDRSQAVRIRAVRSEYALTLNDEVPMVWEVENVSGRTLNNVPVAVMEPPGFGLNGSGCPADLGATGTGAN